MTAPDLIARLAAAQGPDRELDADIWLATRLKWTDREYFHWQRNNDDIPNSERDYARERAPRFTYSIDAALTLAPEELTRAVDATAPECGIDVTLFTPGVSGPEFVGTHASEAVATCIAALQARATKGD